MQSILTVHKTIALLTRMRGKISRPKDFSPAIPEEQPSEVTIAEDGDVILQIEDSRAGIERRYRCLRSVLSSKSEYFDILFDPVKFSEGRATEAKLQELLRQYPYSVSIPSSKLPSIVVSDIGELPKACATTSIVVGLFLKILHDPTTTWSVPKFQSVESVALLAIIADRTVATKTIRNYMCGQRMDITLLKERKSATAQQSELDNRQRLLAGLIFGLDAWVRQYSATLIIDRSKRQTRTNSGLSYDEAQEDDALWWRLPSGVEGTRDAIVKDR